MTLDTGNFMTDLATSSTTFMASLSPVITLIIGMLLAFWIASMIINMLQKNKNDETMG